MLISQQALVTLKLPNTKRRLILYLYVSTLYAPSPYPTPPQTFLHNNYTYVIDYSTDCFNSGHGIVQTVI